MIYVGGCTFLTKLRHYSTKKLRWHARHTGSRVPWMERQQRATRKTEPVDLDPSECAHLWVILNKLFKSLSLSASLLWSQTRIQELGGPGTTWRSRQHESTWSPTKTTQIQNKAKRWRSRKGPQIARTSEIEKGKRSRSGGQRNLTYRITITPNRDGTRKTS